MLNDNERMELLGATRRLEEEAPEPTSTEYLVNALQVYGSFFVVAFPLFCIIRKQFPKTYAVRQWVPVIKTSIAENQFGYITWLWKLYSFSSDDLRANVGLGKRSRHMGVLALLSLYKKYVCLTYLFANITTLEI